MQGFTAVRFTEMNEDFNRQHQDIRTEKGVDYGDLPDFVDFNYVQKVGTHEPIGIGKPGIGTSRTTKCWRNYQRLNQ